MTRKNIFLPKIISHQEEVFFQMPVTLRDISKSGGYNPPPGPLSRFPDLKNKIQAAMDFKKQSKAANAHEKYIFLHFFIIFGEPRKIQKRRKNARKIFIFCMFSMGSNGFRFVHWAHRTRLSGGLFCFSWRKLPLL